MYGCESLALRDQDIKQLESAQGTLVKQAVGLLKRSHHSSLLKALCIPQVSDIINRNILSLYNRIFAVDSPARDLCCELLKQYVHNGSLIKGTILYNVKQSGHSPVLCAFIKPSVSLMCNNDVDDGVVESLRYLLCHENYIRPHSTEHLLASLLTRAF